MKLQIRKTYKHTYGMQNDGYARKATHGKQFLYTDDLLWLMI